MVSYRCTYRAVVEEEPCHFNLSENVQILNQQEFEENDASLKIKLTVDF